LKRLVWSLAGLLLVLVSLLAAGFWLTATPSGFAWLIRGAGTLSQDRLQFERISGDLRGVLGIGKLTMVGVGQRIEIVDLRLEWQPRALWQRRIEVDLLAARSLRVTILKPDPTPPRLPDSLRLGWDARVRNIDLASLEIVSGGPLLAFSNLRASLDGYGDLYRLARINVATPWAALHGDIELGKDAPFALQGAFRVERSQALAAHADMQFSGSLAAPEFSLDASAEGMTLMARGELAPFAATRLTRMLVAGQGIDPRRFAAAAPQADLAFSGLFEGRLVEDKPEEQTEEQTGTQAGERLLGTFSLSNRLAGRLDQQRLPLVELTGAVLGDSDQADFSALLIDLGAAGRFSGSGRWHDGRAMLELVSAQLNLAGLHRALKPTRIQTSLQLGGDALRQQLGAEFSSDWGQGGLQLSHGDAVLRLDTLSFSGQAGRLAAKGAMQLDAGRAFSGEFDASRINPAHFGQFPVARLNARGQLSGALLPEMRLQAEFTLPPGELEGRPVKGRGRLLYEQRHLQDADIDLDLAGNLARIRGAYGQPGDVLIWNVNAPALARLNLGLAGRLISSGRIATQRSGQQMLPRIEAELAGSGLHLPGAITADKLNLKLDLQAEANASFTGRLDAQGIALADWRLSQLLVDAEGRRDAHTLNLDARLLDGRLGAGRLTAALAGGLDANSVWRGVLRQAEFAGTWPMRLTAPAQLLLSRDRQQIEHLALNLAGGEVKLAQFSRDGMCIASSGSASNLPLAPLLTLLTTPPPLTSDLRFNADWNLRLADALDGHLELRRQSGDLGWQEPRLPLGLSALTIDLDIVANRVNAHIAAAGTELGSLRADGQASLARAGAGFSLPRGAPLTWKAELEMPDLRLLKPFVPLGMRADAQISARLSGSGSLAASRYAGWVNASRIRFTMPEEGIAITDGRLALELDDDRVRVQEGVLHSGSGRVVLSGEAQLRNPQAGLRLRFEKFAASNRSDRRIIVSGDTRLNLDAKRLLLSGELTADRARLEMQAAGRPVLGADVVIVGQPPRPASASRRFPLALDLKLNLGSDFLFKGAGLDARLGGELRVVTVNQVLRGEGGIQVEEGHYAAYGQKLNIERGILRFIGPIDNPGLDVLAVRKSATVTAGVQVRGTVRRPVVTLYSDPPLPDTEKLAWLVLGHGLDSGGQQEFALLQIAAGALLSQAESVGFQSRLAETLGIDSFDLRAGDGQNLASSVVSVGKRLSSRTQLSYEQSLDGLSQVVKVIYQLSPRVRLEAQAGQQSSIDAFYTREYD